MEFHISDEFRDYHNYLVYCNDVMVSMLQFCDENQLSNERIPFISQEHNDYFQAMSKDNDGKWQDWLINNGYKETMYRSFYKHTFFSLLSDLCHYMFESIHCAAQMKVAVAYALLRKPLRDNLYYLEWLHVNKEELIDKILNGQPDDITINKQRAKLHIDKINPDSTSFAQMSFLFRYDKNDEKSLEKIWNKANHLITTHSYTKTEQGNINFIYSTQDELENYTGFYYTVVPYIMSYIITLLAPMFEEIAGLSTYTSYMNNLIRDILYASALEAEEQETLKELLNKEKIPVFCPSCGHQDDWGDHLLVQFSQGGFTCPKCFSKIEFTGYVFDWEIIEFEE